MNNLQTALNNSRVILINALHVRLVALDKVINAEDAPNSVVNICLDERAEVQHQLDYLAQANV